MKPTGARFGNRRIAIGTDIEAVLAIDDNTPSDQPPFTYDPSYWDLRKDWGLLGGKHYEFYAAIAGVRDETGVPPLIPPRGVPRYLAPQLVRRVAEEPRNIRAMGPFRWVDPLFEALEPSPSNGLRAFLPADWPTGLDTPPAEPLGTSKAFEEQEPVCDEVFPLFDSLCSSAVVGWLTLEEIGAAMAHHGLDRSRLDDSVLLVLDAMAAAEARYGKGRVHLVFGIE